MSAPTFTEHADRLDAKLVRTDALVVGPAGTDMNKEWIATTTTLTGGSLGGTAVNQMRYTVIGKTCFWTLVLLQTAAGVQTGTLIATLPVRARTDSSAITLGHGSVQTDTNGNFIVIVNQDTQSTCFFRIVNQTLVTQIDATTAALDNNGSWVLTVAGQYEIA